MAQKSPWTYILIGCLAVVFLAVLAVVGSGLFLFKKGKQMAEELADPVARADKVMEVLGAQELPPGYHPMLGLAVPFVFQMAMLSDREPEAGADPQGFDERGFIYVDSRDFGRDREELRDYLQGQGPRPEALRRISVTVDGHDELRRGRVEVAGIPFYYVSFRGELDTGDQDFDGIQTILFADCPPPDKRVRMAFWFSPDPTPEAASEDLEVVGTPADEVELARFLGYFSLCPR